MASNNPLNCAHANSGALSDMMVLGVPNLGRNMHADGLYNDRGAIMTYSYFQPIRLMIDYDQNIVSPAR